MLRERTLVAAARMTIYDNELLTRVGPMVHVVTTLVPEVCSRSTKGDEINRACGLKSEIRKEKKELWHPGYGATEYELKLEAVIRIHAVWVKVNKGARIILFITLSRSASIVYITHMKYSV